MIKYQTNLDDITSDLLDGFFVDWPNPPNQKTFFKLLKKSYKIVLAKDNERVVGFISAISDGVLSAYIPLLEVLPEYQKQGIGKILMQMMIEQLKDLYMVDLLCDQELISYYEKIGMTKSYGAMLRNYDKQSGTR